ncbi:MAG: LAGLIDADG family homing endonuclease, partial [Nitrososphaerota archaeon]
GISGRRISRALLEAFGILIREDTIYNWLNKGRSPIGNCVGLRECEELAYSLTAYLGDGTKCIRHYNGHTQYILTLKVTDYDFAEYFGYAVAKVVGREKPYKPIVLNEHHHKRYGCKRRFAVSFCNKAFYELTSQRPWVLYEFILRKYPAVAISGFFDAEGGVWGRYIGAENKDYELILVVQQLLSDLGVHSTIYYRRDRNIYALLIYRNDAIIEFYRKISFKIQRKQEKLKKLAEELFLRQTMYA